MAMNDGGPAFPVVITEDDFFGGMTLRDYFAGQALTGMLAIPEHGYGFSDAAHDAYKFADAMLTERQKESGK